MESLHDIYNSGVYATVILPVATPKIYTYVVPKDFVDKIQSGIRVEVQFGKNKLYSGIVYEIHKNKPESYQPKPILTLIDEKPIVNAYQLKLWKWMASYYLSPMGSVMNAALPANLKLASETKIMLNPLFNDDFADFSDKEYLIAEALTIQNEIAISDIQKILDQKTVYPILYKLLEKGVIYIKEEIKSKYKPKMIPSVKLAVYYQEDDTRLAEAFDKIKRSLKQTEALLALLQLQKSQENISKKQVYEKGNANAAVLKELQKKEIIEFYERPISRIVKHDDELLTVGELSDFQKNALDGITELFETKNVVLLHGVTGSGKTRIYIEMMKDIIADGGQVLYLLPEIALTTQMISRLKKVFGDEIVVSHSRLNNNERVDIWKAVGAGMPVVLGARSSVFLPFKNLKLVIIDEEHDDSFKQSAPAPRYNGRDVGIFLAHLFGAKTLLGTATPAISTYYNALKGKFGLVEMTERFGGISMPKIEIIDKKDALKKNRMKSVFTIKLIDAIEEAIKKKEQIILFQNRRGYSPVMQCEVCGWHTECKHCDVTMTYHKYFNNLQCHYCGSQQSLPTVCPACGSSKLSLKGHGTEKILEELEIIFPDAKIKRMDLDTVRTKNALNDLIAEFENKDIDILIGTQMVTKGLDFENVTIVGVLSADQSLHMPDYRANERSFQLLTQVSGRAGRAKKEGIVMIQAFDTAHPVLHDVVKYDYINYFKRELSERQRFRYPPYSRLIKITLKHKDPRKVNEAGKILGARLKRYLGDRVLGPAKPSVARVRNQFLIDFLIKIEINNKTIQHVKKVILEQSDQLTGMKGFSSVRVNIDVDVY